MADITISGKYLTASIGGTEIYDNYAWDCDEDGTILDRSTGANAGWRKEDMGLQAAKVTIKGYMDVGSGQYVPVRRGTIITNLKLYRSNGDSLAAFEIAECLVSRSHQGAEVDGKIEWSATLNSRSEVITNDPG
jgi:hypothetical protein